MKNNFSVSTDKDGYMNTFISNDYCSDWGIWHALREMLQNQLDGVVEKVKTKDNMVVIHQGNGALSGVSFRNKKTNELVGEIEYDELEKRILIWNLGELETGNLLLGGLKDKMDNPEIIGRFGEGMKISALALLRKDCYLTIFTGGQAWRFAILPDNFFTLGGEPRKCLHWKPEEIKDKKLIEKYKGKIAVEIRNLPPEEWLLAKNRCLWLTQKDKMEIKIEINGKLEGIILMNPDFRKQIFVKDIYIQETKNETDCIYGFNSDLKLDRDRNCVPDLNERNRKFSLLLATVCKRFEEIRNKVNINVQKDYDLIPYTILHEMLFPAIQVIYYLHEYIGQDGADRIYKEWDKIHKDLYPSYNESEVKNFLFMKKLPNEFYQYAICGWRTFITLKLSP